MEFLSRRSLLKQSLAVILTADAAAQLSRPDWKPEFLNTHQHETLLRLSELIIPSTDSPGAKEALADRFLDKLMAVQPPDTQQEFLAILHYLDEETQKRYRANFKDCSEAQQTEFLTLIAYPHSYPTWATHTVVPIEGNTYFSQMKGWIVGAYYSSEIGLKELGWNGEIPHGHWEGCGQKDV